MRLPALALLLTLTFSTALRGADKHPKPAPAPDHVGVTARVFHPAASRNWRGAQAKELHCTIWYPAAASAIEAPQYVGPPDAPLFEAGSTAPHAAFAPSLEKLPIILLSHGSGGSAMQLAWLGTALARAGYVAVAVDHPGNNALEPYTAAGFVLWWERATDLSNALDGLLADPELGPHMDARLVGAAGFSLGGYTVLELGGARTDVSVIYDRCRAHPDDNACHAPEMRDMGSPQQMLETVRKTSGESLARSADSFRDPRVRAVFAIAPGLSETQTAESLRAMRLPVQIVVGSGDTMAPADRNADWLRMNIHGARETVLPGGVAHYTFLDTCTPAGKQKLGVYCQDATTVDRDAVHAQVSNMAINFFDRALGK